MYDLITRVPMVVWAPGIFEGGRSIDGLCQHMDIGPAILELAGVDVPESFEAKSILPVLKGDSWNRGNLFLLNRSRMEFLRIPNS